MLTQQAFQCPDHERTIHFIPFANASLLQVRVRQTALLKLEWLQLSHRSGEFPLRETVTHLARSIFIASRTVRSRLASGQQSGVSMWRHWVSPASRLCAGWQTRPRYTSSTTAYRRWLTKSGRCFWRWIGDDEDQTIPWSPSRLPT